MRDREEKREAKKQDRKKENPVYFFFWLKLKFQPLSLLIYPTSITPFFQPWLQKQKAKNGHIAVTNQGSCTNPTICVLFYIIYIIWLGKKYISPKETRNHTVMEIELARRKLNS